MNRYALPEQCISDVLSQAVLVTYNLITKREEGSMQWQNINPNLRINPAAVEKVRIQKGTPPLRKEYPL